MFRFWVLGVLTKDVKTNFSDQIFLFERNFIGGLPVLADQKIDLFTC